MDKNLKKELRNLHVLAYEKETKIYLEKLYNKFQEWRNGDISSIDLSSLLHEYDYGQLRELFTKYNTLDPEVTVSRALVDGLIQRNEISDSAFISIERLIEFFQNQKDIE